VITLARLLLAVLVLLCLRQPRRVGRRPVARATGAPDPGGIRQLVAGTGGRHLRPFVATDPTSEARDASTFGVLFLTLRPSGEDWRFSPAVGTFTDAGSSDCHA
jgi:hypothetical protein